VKKLAAFFESPRLKLPFTSGDNYPNTGGLFLFLPLNFFSFWIWHGGWLSVITIFITSGPPKFSASAPPRFLPSGECNG